MRAVKILTLSLLVGQFAQAQLLINSQGNGVAFDYELGDGERGVMVTNFSSDYTELNLEGQYDELSNEVQSLSYSSSGDYVYFVEAELTGSGTLWRYSIIDEEVEEVESTLLSSQTQLGVYENEGLYLTIKGENALKEIVNSNALSLLDVALETATSLSPTLVMAHQSSGGMSTSNVYLGEEEKGKYARTLDHHYELTDHLGNTRVVVEDRRDGNTAMVERTQGYYAYGMDKPGMGYSVSAYLYGFNGKERDDEVKGSGNSYDFGARQYDPRLGRWLSRDPLEGMFPSMSAYNFALDNPIRYIDPDGRIPVETVWDAAALGFDAIWYAVTGDPAAGAAMAVDITALLTPYVPSPGPIMTITGRTMVREVPEKVAQREVVVHTADNVAIDATTSSARFIDEAVPYGDDFMGPIPFQNSGDDIVRIDPNAGDTRPFAHNDNPVVEGLDLEIPGGGGPRGPSRPNLSSVSIDSDVITESLESFIYNTSQDFEHFDFWWPGMDHVYLSNTVNDALMLSNSVGKIVESNTGRMILEVRTHNPIAKHRTVTEYFDESQGKMVREYFDKDVYHYTVFITKDNKVHTVQPGRANDYIFDDEVTNVWEMNETSQLQKKP